MVEMEVRAKMSKTEQDLMSLPKKKFKFMNLAWIVILVAGLFVSINVTNTHLSELFANFGQFTEIFVQMSHPDWSYSSTVIPLLLETIKMAVLGTLFGSIVAFVYSLLIARNIVKNKAVTGILRVIMNIIRTIPDLLLGAIFVAIVGIGPVAGEVNKAKAAIDGATKDADVKTAQSDGEQAISNVNVPDTSATKDAAKNAIDQALNNKKSEINGATNIDQTTKDNLIKEATDAADAAKNAIDQATTADAIKKAQDDGISNINNLNQGTDATKDNVQNSNSNGKVTNVDDQGNTTITYPDGSKSTISGDDYTYNDFYQVIIKANAVEVYTLPKGNLTKEKKLVHDTVLTVLETKKIDGQVWYRIGTNRWIMAATTIKVGELENFKLKRLSKKTKTTAIVWVNKLAIYNNVNGKMTKKHLTRGTKVRIYAIATTNDGEWYKIGKNKWIPAAGVHELTVEPL